MLCRLEQSISGANVGGRHVSKGSHGGEHLPQDSVACKPEETPRYLPSATFGWSQISLQGFGGLDDQAVASDPLFSAHDSAVGMASSGGPVTEALEVKGSRVGTRRHFVCKTLSCPAGSAVSSTRHVCCPSFAVPESWTVRKFAGS